MTTNKAKSIYRMSETGLCPKALAAQRLDYEPLPRSELQKTILEESQEQEDRVVAKLEREGCLISDRQREYTVEELLYNLQGHIDGIAHLDSNSYLLEIKTMSRFVFDKYRRDGLAAFPQYQAQVTCYAQACKLLPILYVVKCRDTGVVTKKFMSARPVGFEMSFRDIIDKLNWVELCARDGILPDAKYDEKDCRYCRFKYLCMGEPQEVIKTEDSATLLEAAELWTEGEQYKKLAEERLEQAKQVFLNHAKSQSLAKFDVADLRVSYYGQRQRSYLDEKVIKELVDEDIWRKAYKEGKSWDDIRIRPIKVE